MRLLRATTTSGFAAKVVARPYPVFLNCPLNWGSSCLPLWVAAYENRLPDGIPRIIFRVFVIICLFRRLLG